MPLLGSATLSHCFPLPSPKERTPGPTRSQRRIPVKDAPVQGGVPPAQKDLGPERPAGDRPDCRPAGDTGRGPFFTAFLQCATSPPPPKNIPPLTSPPGTHFGRPSSIPPHFITYRFRNKKPEPHFFAQNVVSDFFCLFSDLKWKRNA